MDKEGKYRNCLKYMMRNVLFFPVQDQNLENLRQNVTFVEKMKFMSCNFPK